MTRAFKLNLWRWLCTINTMRVKRICSLVDPFVKCHSQGMPTRSPRSIARSDIFAIASLGFMVGTFSVLAMLNAAREHWLEACL
jgi:hypothetical protein